MQVPVGTGSLGGAKKIPGWHTSRALCVWLLCWLCARYGWNYKRVHHFLCHFYICIQVVINLLSKATPFIDVK